MSKQPESATTKAASDFSKQAGKSQAGIFREYVAFMRYSKKWWLIPIVLTLLLVGVLVILSSTAAAPFIYTLF